MPTCPAGQTYKCGPPVPPSCDNPTGVDGVCVDGCFCNDGTVLNANGQCVTEDQCGSKFIHTPQACTLRRYNMCIFCKQRRVVWFTKEFDSKFTCFTNVHALVT